jgi:RNA polymerase sigma-70 factor (ECF subfamily)
MVEDKILMWRYKCGNRDALARIYEKYEAYLLTLAAALLNDVYTAEDVVHDFFVSFAQSADKLRLDGNLKGYLVTCVANRARDQMRARRQQPLGLDQAYSVCSNSKKPDACAMFGEELRLLSLSLCQLPYEQREVLILHFFGRMKFKTIAKVQDVSVNTVQSRYRYGLDKLRLLLNRGVK